MKKIEKKNLKNLILKRGISLVTLIITIIVMIILASVITMSLNNNDVIGNASTARCESDRDSMQMLLQQTVQKIQVKYKSSVDLDVGAINIPIKDVNSTKGEMTWYIEKEGGLTGKIVFGVGNDTETVFYTGKELPVYGGETIWYVNGEQKLILQASGKLYGADEIPKNIIGATQIKANPSVYYGKTVKYDSVKASNYEWQIFHVDGGGIYLISKDYITREDVPYSWKNGVVTTNKPGRGGSGYERSITFINIVNDYANGSEDVKKSMRNLNNDYYLKGYTSSNRNFQSPAYMLDTEAWSEFVSDKANWAIGGPSIELLCKSYNAYKGAKVLKCEATSNIGYKISLNGGTLNNYLYVFSASDANGMYRISDTKNAYGYCLASPSAIDKDYIASVEYNGYVGRDGSVSSVLGVRSVVYLKLNVKLEELVDGTYKVI